MNPLMGLTARTGTCKSVMPTLALHAWTRRDCSKDGARENRESPRQPTNYAGELVAGTSHPLARRHHQHERIPTQRRRLRECKCDVHIVDPAAKQGRSQLERGGAA